MSSLELENRQIIHEDIIPRIKLLEDEQKVILTQIGVLANQMKALELSNNDVKQTVVGFGQTHSMLLTKAMESIVTINTAQTQLTREVQTTKEKVVGEIQQTQSKADSEVAVARLSMKEKIFIAVIATPTIFTHIPTAYTFIKDMFE